MARLYETLDAGLIEIVSQPSGEPYAERAPHYYKIVSSSKETKEVIKTGHMLRVFPTADEIEKITKTHKALPENSWTAGQSPVERQNSEIYQGERLSDRPSDSVLDSVSELDREPEMAETDPDDLPLEEEVDDVDRAHVNVDRVYPLDSSINTVNNSSENNKEPPKHHGITLEELDRKIREAGVDMGGPLWRGKV